MKKSEIKFVVELDKENIALTDQMHDLNQEVYRLNHIETENKVIKDLKTKIKILKDAYLSLVTYANKANLAIDKKQLWKEEGF